MSRKEEAEIRIIALQSKDQERNGAKRDEKQRPREAVLYDGEKEHAPMRKIRKIEPAAPLPARKSLRTARQTG